MQNKTIYSILGGFIAATFCSFLALRMPNTLAVTSGNTEAKVTVTSSCSMINVVDQEHTATIVNGHFEEGIGETTLQSFCNDLNGYAIYAVGFSNYTYGDNTMASSVDSAYNIQTGTATSGDTSSWSMKIGSVAGTYAPTIENSFNNYHTVPSTYTKIASFPAVTDTVEGSSVTATYATYISPYQVAGTYTGKVKYTLLHPSTTIPKTINDLTYMQDFKDLNEGEKEVVKDSMILNQEYTLTDQRDGKEYFIAKLADGNIWMTQNLDHNIVTTPNFYTSQNTDIPTSSSPLTINTATYTNTTWNNSTTAPRSYDPGDKCWNGVVRDDPDSTLNNSIISCSDSSANKHYSIGNYYNWTAAVATNDSSEFATKNQDANQSICPAGWRLPTYSGDKSYRNLVDTLGLTAGASGNIYRDPVYFVYGDIFSGSSITAGNRGYYWSSVVYDGSDAEWVELLWYNAAPHYSAMPRVPGASVRCVAR